MQSTATETRRRAAAKPNGRTCGAKTNGKANTARHPADLTIRPAVPGDFEPLSFFFDTALRKDYFIRRGQLKDILSGPRHQVYVAEIDAILVGLRHRFAHEGRNGGGDRRHGALDAGCVVACGLRRPDG